MRIARIEIENHPSLGNLDFDLMGPDGKAARQVVLAGENGCGKTAILDVIQGLLVMGSIAHLGTPETAARLYLQAPPPHVLNPQPGMLVEGGNAQFQRVRAFAAANPEFVGIVVSSNMGLFALPQLIPYLNGLSNYTRIAAPLFYSNASISFDVAGISTISGFDEEVRVAGNVRQAPGFQTIVTPQLGSEIAQLLVNLKSADDTDVSDWVEAHPGGVPPEDIKKRRIRRFTDAFATVMPNKRLSRIRREASGYEIMFEGTGAPTKLSQLSTGEKQIVFRGAFLLRSLDHLPGTVVLVDEPELSLHPAWQSNILGFYDRIVAETEELTSQIIVATHSPFVVHGSPTAKHIVLHRDPVSGEVAVDPHPTYPGVTAGDVAIAAFNLVDINFGEHEARLVIVTEGKSDQLILETAWRKLKRGERQPFHIAPAGGAKSIMNLLGTSASDRGWLYATFEGRAVDRYLALYDFDDPGYGQWRGLVARDAEMVRTDEAACMVRKRRDQALWSALLPVPEFRRDIANQTLAAGSKMAIELMFRDEFLEGRLNKTPLAGDPPSYIFKAEEPQKMPFARATAEFPESAFEAFRPLFALVDEILGAPI